MVRVIMLARTYMYIKPASSKDYFGSVIPKSPEQAPPVKPSILALDVLAFTGGACSWEYCTIHACYMEKACKYMQ